MPPAPAPKKTRKWPWVVGGIVVFLIVASAINGKSSGSSTATQPTLVNAGPVASQVQAAAVAPAPAPAPAAASGPSASFSDGTYHVGVDIAPGRYKTAGPSADAIFKDCYWERTKDDSGEFGSIISNGNAQGPGYVTVKNGEFFQTAGGCTWTKQ